MHFYEYASQAPHIDREVVGNTEEYLRRPVEPETTSRVMYLNSRRGFRSLLNDLISPRLNVLVYPLPELTRAAKVHELNRRTLRVAQQDVLGLQITVDYLELCKYWMGHIHHLCSSHILDVIDQLTGLPGHERKSSEVVIC